MRVQIVDPPAFTPPYDRALCAALAAAGADVELVTSRFEYGPVPPARGYQVTDLFYRRSTERGLEAPGRRGLRLAEHVPGMRRLRTHAADADVVHLQWLSVPDLDRFLLPPRPRAFTVHYPLPASESARGRQRALLSRMDAVIAHSEQAAGELRALVGDSTSVHRIPHGAFEHLTRQADERPLPDELARVEGPVILCFGLVRPYKGVDVLLEAFAAIEGAELWVVGMPRMDLTPLRGLAERCAGTVRFVDRFITDPEIPAFFRRADVVALPYRRIEQSGVLYTALAFGNAIVASAIGGFTEVGERDGALRLVPPADPAALASALSGLIADPGGASRARDGRRPRRGRSVFVGADRAADARRLRRAGGSVTVAAVVFWVASGLLVYTHLLYPLALAGLASGRRSAEPTVSAELPAVSLIVAAHDEEQVIAAKVANALALDYPRERLQVIVASDGSADATTQAARDAGADLVLDLERMGKLPAQNVAAERATGDLLAFSDANATWEPGALRALVAPFADPAVGYACGQARLLDQGGSNQEGAYWRYELAVRSLESRLAGITAGNGAIYAVRTSAYLPLGPASSHDLSFPFMFAKRGLRSVYVADAVSTEKMVATTEGEFARKRRMMVGIYDEVVGDGMINPRGYPPLYGFEIFSHRVLRYASPFLHAVALIANLLLLDGSWIYAVTLAIQLAVLAAAALAGAVPLRPLQVARYYVLMTASIAAGFWDRMRGGTPGAWEKAEGTR